MPKENYVRVSGWDATLEPCPFCGSPAEMWSHEIGSAARKVVMCSKSGDDDNAGECPMYMPGEAFYQDTKTQAREVWNTRAPNA